MPLSQEVRERVRDFVGLTEEIRYIFPALLTAPTLGGAHMFFIVTDSAITLVTTKWLSRTKPDSVWGTYPRRSRLGPVETGAGVFFEFNGTHFEIDDEYIAVVNAADAEVFDRDSLPEDPLPDL